MLIGIDHLVIAAADPDAAAADLEAALGIEVDRGGRHEALGTFNRLAWFGDTFVEVIGVFDRALAERSWIGVPTLRALEAGGGLVTWSMATNALAEDVSALRSAGSDIGETTPGERLRPDGRTVRWQMAGPPTLSPTSPFLIEHDLAAAEWNPADRAARAARLHPAGGPIRLEVLELPVPDMSRSIQRLLRGVGLRFRPSLAGGGSRDAGIGPHLLRLRPMRAGDHGTAVIRLAGHGLAERSVEQLGCRWLLRPS